MLRKLRTVAAIVCFTLITLLFLDFTGTLHQWFWWLAKIQFLPALIALNLGVVAALVAVTLVFGRIYCSVICPLGVLQDIISWAAGRRKKNRFSYRPAFSLSRYGILAICVLAFIAGIDAMVSLLDPYSAYGRIASNLIAPVYQWGNNILAYVAERFNSYMFYSTDVWMKSATIVCVSVATLIMVAVLAWHRGRMYCNAMCPVGTILGFLSKFSYLKPVIDKDVCNSCGLCARNCKASCINSKEHSIDYSRCVACMDCIFQCNRGAVKYISRRKNQQAKKEININTDQPRVTTVSRRMFLYIPAFFAFTTVLKAQQKKVEGGLAFIKDKKVPKRTTPITPPGSLTAHHFAQHCTACQLCVSVCPNQVLVPSSGLRTLMQPEMSYHRGYCRPECVKCSTVCPTGAIQRITVANKSALQIGHAVWLKQNCVVNTDKVSCDNCARHCPVGAIQMVPGDAHDPKSLPFPAVDTERCIGCGACENLCPARPFSAIYVEGHERHRTV